MLLQVFNWVCLELMAETNEIGTGSKVHKNDGQSENSNTYHRLLGDTLLHDMYEGAK